MTKEPEKSSDHCLICSNKVGVSTRNSVRIFHENSKTESEKPIIDTICSVLEKNIDENNAHSVIICKKCYKIFNEYDELETRILEIKQEISNNYQKTIKKLAESVQIEEECNDHDYLDSTEHYILEEEDEGDENHIEQYNQDEKVSDYLQLKDEDDNIEEHLVEYLQEDYQEIDPDDPQAVMTEEYIEDPIGSFENPIDIKLEEETSGEMNTENTKSDEIAIVNPPVECKVEEKKKKELKKTKIIVTKEEVQDSIVFKDGDSYTCLLCSENNIKLSGDAKEIISHMRETHEARLYICDVCGRDFRKRNELSVHLDEHVEKEEGDFQCEICNRIFGNLRLFRVHKRIHYPQVKSWTCDTCGKRYSSKNLLDEHVNTHNGVRPYVCEVCNKDFASKYTYKAHAKTHEVRPRPFECHQCNKTFLSQQNLNQHERTHLGVKEFVCHECGKAFGSPHNLEVHSIVHTGYKPYSCGMCGKAFARKAEIRDHERTHTGEKPYQCEFCGATFSQRSNLQSHKRATHYNDKRYKCDDCGKGFKRRRLLDYHIKAVHTGERPYKCDKCTATFVYPEHWKKHMRIHTGEKPYLCEVCGKAFNSRDNRNAHRFIHSDKKPYECLVCGLGFMRKPLLYAHMQSAGHLNDTIVVNQPRLTTEDQVISIPDGDVELLMEEGDPEQLEGTELYVTELKDHVIIQQDGAHIYQEESVLEMTSEEHSEQEHVGHIVVNSQIAFAEGEEMECKSDNGDEVYAYNGEEGETIVIPASSEYKGLINDGKTPLRLVHLRYPSSDSKEWMGVVQQRS